MWRCTRGLPAIARGSRDVQIQRAELLRAVESVLDLVTAAEVSRVFGQSMKPETVMHLHKTWATKRHELGDVEGEILQSMGLSPLDDANVWASALGNGANTQIAQAAENGASVLAEVASLLSRDADSLANVSSEGPEPDVAKLSVLVLEDERASTPERLALVLTSVHILYQACAEVVGHQDIPITVIACDSGSDKLFDFAGSGEILREVRLIIFGIWDRLLLRRENKTDRWLDQVAKSLPIIDRVAEMEASGALSPEQAEVLRRQLVGATCDFAKAGAVVPELEQGTYSVNARELMGPLTRMLMPAQLETGPLGLESGFSADDQVDEDPLQDSSAGDSE